MRACLIFNPRAGTADRIKDFLLQLTGDHRCELRPTTAPGDARRIAREAVAEGFDRIIVGGGDGTINQVVNGIAPDFGALELAILPFGTGNDLARSLGLTPDCLDQACTRAFGTQVEPIDIVRVSGDTTSYCINVANGGFGGRVAADIQSADKKRWGPMAYWMTSVSRLVDLQQYEVTLRFGNQSIDTTTFGVAIANGRFVGGGFPIAPTALLNDGLLDVTTIPVLPTLELMAAGLNFALGRHHRDDRVRSYRVRELHLHATPAMPLSVDGEPTQRFDATFSVLPQVLRVVVGDNPPGLTDTPATATLD